VVSGAAARIGIRQRFVASPSRSLPLYSGPPRPTLRRCVLAPRHEHRRLQCRCLRLPAVPLVRSLTDRTKVSTAFCWARDAGAHGFPTRATAACGESEAEPLGRHAKRRAYQRRRTGPLRRCGLQHGARGECVQHGRHGWLWSISQIVSRSAGRVSAVSSFSSSSSGRLSAETTHVVQRRTVLHA